MKIKFFSYKEKQIILEVAKNTQIKEIREILGQKIHIDYKDIKLLFCSQDLSDNQTLEYYNIQDGSTIFYYNKKAKSSKNKTKNSDKYNKDDKGDEIIKPKEELDILQEDKETLKIYSSLIKILTYQKEDNMKIMKLILDNLKNSYKEDSEIITKYRDIFLNFLKEPINQEDIDVYKNNYLKAHNLIKKPADDKKEEEKFDIYLTDTEELYFNYWESRGLEKETIILEYVKNKFDKEKTDKNLLMLCE